MGIEEVITHMNTILARDAICNMIANERDNQIELARKGGADENWILQNIDFTIYPKKFRFPDISNMPCVFVYFDEIDFPENEQDIYENYAKPHLQIDYFVAGKTETGPNRDNVECIIKTADENASDRLDYLSSQLYKILCCEENAKKGADNLVRHCVIKKWKRIIMPQDENMTTSVLGAAYEFELGLNEPAYYCSTHKIKEFYTNLKIRDEFIAPFVKMILNS